MKLIVASTRRILARCALALGCLLAAVPAAETAHAQATPEDIDRARRLFQRGLEYEQAENWGKALELFREVGQVKLTPQVRYHIALCEESLGKLVAALGGYKLALRGADAVGPGFKTEVEGRIEQLAASIPKLVIKRGKGAEGATMSLDGAELGTRKIGVEVPVDPGPHTITATAPGYEDYMDTVSVDEKKTETVTVKMKKVASDKKPGPVTPGGGGDVPKWEEPDRTVAYVIGGAGIAAALAGGVFFYLRLDSISSAEELCGGSFEPCDGSDEDVADADAKLKEATTYTTIAGISVGVGAAALGVALTMILTEPSPPAGVGDARLLVAPQVSPSHGGVALLGRF